MNLASQSMNVQWKRQAIDKHPLYRTLTTQEREELAQTITDEQAMKLAQPIYGSDLIDTERQITQLQEKLKDIESASNTAWLTGNIQGLYTPAQRRILAYNKFADIYLSQILGTNNATKYEQTIKPEVVERFKQQLLTTVQENAQLCTKRAQKLEELIVQWETQIDTHKGSIEYYDNAISIANAQAVEMSAQYQELSSSAVDYSDPTAYDQVIKMREKRAALRKKSRFFETHKRQASNTIRTEYRKLSNTIKRLNVARTMATPLLDLASKYQDIAYNLQSYSGQEPTLINAGELSNIMQTYNTALQVVIKHDDLLDSSTTSLIEATPDNLGKDYNVTSPPTAQKNYAQEQTRYEREARNIAKIVREMEF